MTGVSDLASIDAQMDLARELVPNAKNIGLIYCSSEVNSEIQANMVKDYCKANGLNVVEKTVDRKSTRLNSSHKVQSRMPSSA